MHAKLTLVEDKWVLPISEISMKLDGESIVYDVPVPIYKTVIDYAVDADDNILVDADTGEPVIMGKRRLLAGSTRQDVRAYLTGMTPEERAEHGWVELVEDRVDNMHAPGEPLDILLGATTVSRSFPNKILMDVGVLRNQRRSEADKMARDVGNKGMIHAGHPWSTDPDTRNVIALLGHRPVKAGFRARAADGAMVPMSRDAFAAYRDALAGHMEDTHTAWLAHIDALDALATSQEVADYDLTAGWPANPVVS